MSRAFELYKATALADTTTTVGIGGSGHNASKASFFLDVSAAAASTSTWTVDLYAVTPDGNTITVAAKTSIDATTISVVEIPIASAFTNSNDCIPMPDRVVLTRTTGPGDLTARLIAFAAKD